MVAIRQSLLAMLFLALFVCAEDVTDDRTSAIEAIRESLNSTKNSLEGVLSPMNTEWPISKALELVNKNTIVKPVVDTATEIMNMLGLPSFEEFHLTFQTGPALQADNTTDSSLPSISSQPAKYTMEYTMENNYRNIYTTKGKLYIENPTNGGRIYVRELTTAEIRSKVIEDSYEYVNINGTTYIQKDGKLYSPSNTYFSSNIYFPSNRTYRFLQTNNNSNGLKYVRDLTNEEKLLLKIEKIPQNFEEKLRILGQKLQTISNKEMHTIGGMEGNGNTTEITQKIKEMMNNEELRSIMNTKKK